MIYGTDAAIAEFDHLRLKQRRYVERMGSRQEVMPAVKMLIGDWFVDEFGIARDQGARLGRNLRGSLRVQNPVLTKRTSGHFWSATHGR
jgi:hypothetical protein